MIVHDSIHLYTIPIDIRMYFPNMFPGFHLIFVFYIYIYT